jgi:outer membrane protein assembly factor BamB
VPQGALIDLGDVSPPATPVAPDGETGVARPGFGRRLAMAAVATLTMLVPVASAAPEPLSTRPPLVLELDGQLALADDTVYSAPRPTNRLRAYALDTGALRWVSQVSVYGQFFVRRVDRVVLVSVLQDGWQTLSLDAATGTPLWSHPGIFAAVDRRTDEAVFVLPAGPGAGGVFDVGSVSAVDLATGRTRWTYPQRGSRVELVLGVATDGTEQVVAGAIQRYGADTELLDFATGGTVPLPPLGDYGTLTLVGDLLLVGTTDVLSGPLKAYDRRTMRLRWTALDGQFAGAVDGCGRWLCVSTPAGVVVVDPANGLVRRRMEWSAVRGGGRGDRSVAFQLDPAASGGVAVVQMSTGRLLARVDGWQPLLTSYADRLPLVRGHLDGRLELGVLDVERGRFYRLGDLHTTSGDPCLASLAYVACSTGAGELRVWRYAD